MQTAGASSISTSARNSSLRVGGDDAAARVNERPLRFPHHLRRAPDLSAVAFGVNPVAGQMNRSSPECSGLRLEHVLRYIHQHRPGPSRWRRCKTLRESTCGSSAIFFTRKLCLVPERVMPNVSAS